MIRRRRHLGPPQGEQLADTGIRTEDGHVEHGHGVGQPAGQWRRSRALGEQEVFPVGDRVLAAGEPVAHQGMDFLRIGSARRRGGVGVRHRIR